MVKKIFSLLSAVLMAVFFISCADDSESVIKSSSLENSGNQKNDKKNDGSGINPSPQSGEMYLPEEFENKTIAASYYGTYAFDQLYMGLQYQDYGVCSLYLFSDGTWVQSVCGDFSWLGSGSVRQPCWKGNWKKEKGNFYTGKVILTHTHTWCDIKKDWDKEGTENEFPLDISNGKFEMAGFNFEKKD